MSSLTYQISHLSIDPTKQYSREQHDRDGNVLVTAELSTQSLRQYKHHAIRFGKWCKKEHGCKTPEECREYIQEYTDKLVSEGLSANTVHTYLAAVCRYWSVPLSEIKKPQRVTANNSKSRGPKAVDIRSDSQRDASPRLYDFAERVGLRRSEYKRLRGNDFIRDESGHMCVRVIRGKGGKFQLQVLLPEDEEYIGGFFDGTTDYIFSKSEMTNKIDLHALRSAQARRAYEYYLEHIQDESFRAKLIEELQARWETENSKKYWNPVLTEGQYHLRGANRSFALSHGLPTSYNRLALLAVSIFHLSHWRTDVTVANYLLAVQ